MESQTDCSKIYLVTNSNNEKETKLVQITKEIMERRGDDQM